MSFVHDELTESQLLLNCVMTPGCVEHTVASTGKGALARQEHAGSYLSTNSMEEEIVFTWAKTGLGSLQSARLGMILGL